MLLVSEQAERVEITALTRFGKPLLYV